MDTITVSDEELYAATVNARINGLLACIRPFADDCRAVPGGNGFPCIDAVIDEIFYRISYLPVGDVNTDRFLLIIRTTVTRGKKNAADNRFFLCETFNAASVLGFAVYLPTDGSVEYRLSVPERGGIQEEEYYRYLFEMIRTSVNELAELIKEGSHA